MYNIDTTAKQVAMVWHMLRKEDTDWVKKCMVYEVEGSRPRGRPKRTWLRHGKRLCKKIAKHVIWTGRMLWIYGSR